MSTTKAVRPGQRAQTIEQGVDRHDRRRARDTRPVGVYGRISKRKAGDGAGATLGIARQHDDGADYARREFGDDVELVFYSDNMSAWNPDAYRADYEQMLTDTADGKLRATIGWHPDRYTRQPEQLERQLKAAAQGDAELHTCSTGLIESALAIRILSAVAAEESDNKSRRIRRKHQELAVAGKWKGGPRPYGWDNVNGELVVNEAEAAVVRELAARAANGESPSALSRWLNANGILTRDGNAWQPTNVRRTLMRPMNAGLRVHNGEVVADGAWVPLLDRTTHELLVAKFSDPKRRTQHGTATRYLLSGLALCDACGESVRGRPFGGRNVGGADPRRAYACKSGRHMHVSQDLADAAVEQLIVERLSQLDAAGALVDDSIDDELDALRRERAALDGKLDDLLDKLLDGELTQATFDRAQAKVAERQRALDELIAQATVDAAAPRVLDGMTGELAAAAWAKASLAHRRAIIAYLCRIRIVGTKATGRRFDPTRDVLVEWLAR